MPRVPLAGDAPRILVADEEPGVRDTGIGLSAEDRERVFEEFYRVRSEQTHGITGTGLGLSLVKRLVE
jgi:signal transduction histidine kinase